MKAFRDCKLLFLKKERDSEGFLECSLHRKVVEVVEVEKANENGNL